MIDREQLRHVCRWNQTLSQENLGLRQALRESQETADRAGVERDTALIFLDTAWQIAAEGQRP
ncbi:MAG: hypothetical protein ABR992_08135 [Solirubrobacteraceae bacterium]|jgi:hypothetical protein